MKLGVIDGINENHVVESFLAAARSRLDLSVVETGRIWRSNFFPEGAAHSLVWNALEDLVERGVDAIFCFRASALTPEMLKWIRSRNITSVVWLPDDPVFFDVCYRHVVGLYDWVLNCGNRKVLEYYEETLNVKGWNFPFWTGKDTFQRIDARKEVDAVFLGNISKGVREDRVSILTNLPCSVRQYGKTIIEACDIGAGWLNTEKEISEALSKAKVAINLSQEFSRYKGREEYFEDLESLGSFEIPSRLVQYIACGLPVVSLSRDNIPGMEELFCARDLEELRDYMSQLLEDEGLRRFHAEYSRQQFERHFTADSRVAFLVDLLNRKIDGNANLQERHLHFTNYRES